MADQNFVTTGDAPRILRIEALAFHDATGRIRHMHHSIVLEGAEPRPFQAMVDEVRTHARGMGIDLGTLKVLHVKMPFNMDAQHKVDVKKGVLVELQPPRSIRGAGANVPTARPRPAARRKQR